MATIDIWIQLEPHAWDVCPTSNVDRITGETINASPQPRTLTSPVTGVTTTRTMRKPLADDALILRRYTENWAAPADRKVNPWDLNEPDPTDNGTMGTIPGPVIECNVGDSVIVHFRNLDQRSRLVTKTIKITLPFIGEIEFPFPTLEPLPVERRAHSLHPHGFVFAPSSDGAYPLSPPDPGQPIPAAETAAWAELGVSGLKQGDRVPPLGTFTYTWETLGWPTTAGVWLYHDHSICDMDNVNAGAIGIIVIHNLEDTENEVDITTDRLPGGSVVGSPVQLRCFPFDLDLPTLPHDLTRLGDLGLAEMAGHHGAGLLGDPTPAFGLDAGLEALLPAHGEHSHDDKDDEEGEGKARPAKAAAKAAKAAGGHHGEEEEEGPPLAVERAVRRGDLILELDEKLERIRRFCIRRYRTPPDQGLYLQLLHEMPGVGMVINGRKYMGNTPTIVAGPNTRMRFGVVGMGNAFHTFHLHGHRWIIPGPTGTTPGDIQASAQVSPVSQFEDTRIFGPANSFVFTVEEGNGFMRAAPPFGEWHMHCHVLGHMMDGMMGSLLVVNGGELVTPLPVGTHCPPLSPEEGHDGGMGDGGMGPKTWDVNITGFAFAPATVTVKVGDSVKWTNNDVDVHTATADGGSFDTGIINRVATGPPPTSATKTFTSAGTFPYHCNVHTSMTATIVVNP